MDNQALEPDRTVLDAALDALEKITGLGAHVNERAPAAAAGTLAEAPFEIEIDAGDQRYPLLAEVGPRVDRATALAAAHARITRIAGDRGVLVTPYLTPTLAEQCRRDLNQQFIDTAGNAYLRQPGLHIIVTGQRRPALPVARAPMVAAGTATALRVIFLLLCRPAMINAPYRDIAEAAGVALGAVGPVLQNLAARQYVIGEPGNRHIVEPLRLFDEWVMNYPTRLRPKLRVHRFAAQDADWWKNLDLAGTGACWGGEIAADRLTHYLKPATCTLYVEPERVRPFIAETATKHRLRRDPAGRVEILEAFWRFPTDGPQPDVVPAPLVFADLVATLEPRNLEVADMVRKQYLEATWNQP